MALSPTGRRPRMAVAVRLALVVASAAALAGCGGAQETAKPAATATSAGTAAATNSAAPAFPVTIQHKFGSTTIPAKPQRVVTVGWNDQDFVLALGVVPVSTRRWFDEYTTYPWVASALHGQSLPAFSADIDYEAILKSRPDLIFAIYETVNKETYDKLSQIATTVVQSSAYPDEMTPWDVQTLTTGK